MLNFSFLKDPQWVTAISTIVLGVITLFAVLAALFPDLWKKPKLKVGLGNEYPNVVNAGQNKYFRITIKNIGRTVARNCKVKLISVVPCGGTETVIEQDRLKWTSAPLDMRYRDESLDLKPSEFLPIYREHIDISPNGGWEMCDLFVITISNLLEFQSLGRRRGLSRHDCYFVKLEISGDNVKPRVVVFKLNNPYDFEHINIQSS